MTGVLINFGDIKGEVTEDKHKDWVAATGVSFQASKTPLKTGVGKTKQGPALSELTVTKSVDTTSPQLFQAFTKGTHIPEVTLDYTRAEKSGGPLVFMQVKLKEVVISGIAHNTTPPGTSAAQSETVTLSYSSMTQTPIMAMPGASAKAAAK